jgi:nicotinamidase-related amidase
MARACLKVLAAFTALPTPGMVIERPRTALVIADLQNDFLSPGGAAGELVRDNLATNNTIENIEALLRAARDGAYPVFLSPHYYYPPITGGWRPAGRSKC